MNPGNDANGWERPPEYDNPPDPPPPDDCLGCGRCEACVQRSAAFAAELNETPTCALCPAFIWAAESLQTGLCFGCRSPGPTERL